jgi:hypothetical protein
MLRIYLLGLAILAVAILLNALVNRLGIMGWYDFLLALGRPDTRAGLKIRLVDGLWLFVLYPALLGGTAVLAERMLRGWGM